MISASPSEDPHIRAAAAANSTATRELLLLMMSDRDERVRAAVAANFRINNEMRLRLARDPSRLVRLEVVEHSASSAAILTEACRDGEPEVLRVACKHPKASAELLRSASERGLDNEVEKIPAGPPEGLQLRPGVDQVSAELNLVPEAFARRGRTVEMLRVVSVPGGVDLFMLVRQAELPTMWRGASGSMVFFGWWISNT